MKISKIHLLNFKRFTDLTITDILASTKLVVLVGPNGSGKSCVLDALNQWHRTRTQINWNLDENYYFKRKTPLPLWDHLVSVEFHDINANQLRRDSMYFRTAYRNEPDFSIAQFTRIGAPYDNPQFHRRIDNDQTVSNN